MPINFVDALQKLLTDFFMEFELFIVPNFCLNINNNMGVDSVVFGTAKLATVY